MFEVLVFVYFHLPVLDTMSYDQSIKSIKKFIPHIDNQVQHIQEESMWERGKFKCNTYNTLSPFMK